MTKPAPSGPMLTETMPVPSGPTVTEDEDKKKTDKDKKADK